MLTAILKMHRLGIVHRDLNPSNIFLHFADLPDDQSPQNVASYGNKSPGKFNARKIAGSSIFNSYINAILCLCVSGMSPILRNPMEHIMES